MPTDHESRFREFHSNNPDVYRELVALARQAVAKGRRRIGIRMLWEVMRWNRFLQTVDNSEYKLNDHYHSRYARLIMEREPDLAGVFEVRELKSGATDDPGDGIDYAELLADT